MEVYEKEIIKNYTFGVIITGLLILGITASNNYNRKIDNLTKVYFSELESKELELKEFLKTN